MDKATEKPEVDEATKQEALEKITAAYLPYHGMVAGWHDALYGGAYGMGYGGYPGYMGYGDPYHPAAALGGLLYPGYGAAWSPDHNVIDMVAQEVTGAHQ